MTELLLKKFIKNHEDIKNNTVREHVGTLSSICGIVCNIFLFTTKFIFGSITNSISIISDGINNLSDCFSCIVTLIGYKLSNQPADKDHPFGHGRIEYFTSLFIAIAIILVGFEFLKSSFEKILHPEHVSFSIYAFCFLILSILIKIWMGLFNKKLGKKYSSETILAVSQDSFSDCITTAVTAFGLLLSLFTSLPIDAIIGCIVSLIILKSGYSIIKDTFDNLLGKPADKETIDDIMNIINQHHDVLGVHDLIVHNYGPGKMMATLHCEVDSTSNINQVHDSIDNIEHEIYEKLKIITTIHMDPIETNNEELTTYRELINSIIKEIDPDLSIHDFRMVVGVTHTNLIFDIVLSFKFYNRSDELHKIIDDKLHESHPELMTVITFDTIH